MIDKRDFTYTLEREYSTHTIWICRLKTHKRCKARVTTSENRVIRFVNEHNHDCEAQKVELLLK